jgi:hypothetical protein
LQTSNLILDFEFDQHLEPHKHVINIIMGFRDTGCYNEATDVDALRVREENGEVSSGTVWPTWEVGSDSLTREREEAAPGSAVSTVMT